MPRKRKGLAAQQLIPTETLSNRPRFSVNIFPGQDIEAGREEGRPESDWLIRCDAPDQPLTQDYLPGVWNARRERHRGKHGRQLRL